MLLAQRFVLLGEESLSLQAFTTYCAYKAGVMPGTAQSFQKSIAGFYREFTSMTHGTKQGVVICLTVGLAVFQVEGIIADRLTARHAHKTGDVPSLLQSIDHFPKYLPVAAGAFRCKELSVAQITIKRALLDHKSRLGHGLLAMGTVKLFRMPRLPQSQQKRSSYHHVTVSTHWCSGPSRDVLWFLYQCVLLGLRRRHPRLLV